MDVFKCIHCGGTELGGFRFDAVDEEGNHYVVDVCMDCLVRISGEHGASEKENQLQAYALEEKGE